MKTTKSGGQQQRVFLDWKLTPAHKEFVKKNFAVSKLGSITDASDSSLKSSPKVKKRRANVITPLLSSSQLSLIQRRKLKNCLPPAKG